MATLDSLQFEMQRRVILFNPYTTMPDGNQLGYNDDPNDASSSADPASGEFLIYSSPVGTRYVELDPSDNITAQWFKSGTPNIWEKLGTDTDASLGNILDHLDSLDASIVRIDTSLNTIITDIDNIESSLGDYVRKDGDIMTGELTTPGLSVTNDLSVGDFLNVDGSANIMGNLSVGGNLIVDGSTTIIDTVRLDVSTSYIHLNTGLPNTIEPPDWLQSGIVVERGSEDPYVFVFDETQETFRIGIAPFIPESSSYSDASTQAVATREDNPIIDAIAFWNSTLSRFDTSEGLTFNEWGLYVDGSLRISKLANTEGQYITADASGNLIPKTLPDFVLEASIGNSLIWDEYGYLQVDISALDSSNISYNSADPSLWLELTGTDPSTISGALDNLITLSSEFQRTGVIIYVKSNAGGNQDGTSWDDAYLTLVEALGEAKPGDEIWIANGTYYPTSVAANRDYSFELKSGVHIYGGFKGYEGSKEIRDVDNTQTILSGDIDSGNTSGYSYNIITGDGIKDVILDGIIVEKSNNDNDNYGGLIKIINNKSFILRNSILREGNGVYGGALYLKKGYVELINNKVKNNHNSGYSNIYLYTVQANIKDNLFKDNITTSNVSVILLFNSFGIFSNNKILNNIGPLTGNLWGTCNTYISSTYDMKHNPLIIKDNLFKENKAVYGSGFSFNLDNNSLNVFILDNVFYKNEAYGDEPNTLSANNGTFYVVNNTFADVSGGFRMENSTDTSLYIWNNIFEKIIIAADNANSTYVEFGNNIFNEYEVISNDYTYDISINNLDGSISYIDPDNNDFTPETNSISIDAGDNSIYYKIEEQIGSLVELGWDYSFNKRITNNIIDIGAVEFNVSASPTYDTTLDDTLEMPDKVGGIPAGTTVADLKGDMLVKLWDDLLFPTVYPTYIVPTSTLSLGTADTLEIIGSSLNFVVTSTFDKGAIMLNGTKQDDRSGNPNYYNFTDPSNNTLLTDVTTSNLSVTQNVNNYEVKQGNQTFTVAVSYDEGPQPKDNKGNDYQTPLAAGTLNPVSKTIEGVYPIFVTTVDLNTLTQQTLRSMSDTTETHFEYSLAPQPDNSNVQKFDIPNAWGNTLSGVKTYNSVSGNWEYNGGSASNSLNQWTTSSVTHTVEGNSVNYTRYSYNSDPRDRISIRLVF